MAKIVNRFIKLDFSLCNAKIEKKFLKLFDNENYKKHIKARSDSSIIISIPLFTLIEYELEQTKGFASKVRIDLLEKEQDSSKGIETLYSNVHINSEQYDEVLRTLRF